MFSNMEISISVPNLAEGKGIVRPVIEYNRYNRILLKINLIILKIYKRNPVAVYSEAKLIGACYSMS